MSEQDVPDDQVALIDLDGTAADYDTAMIRQLQVIAGPDEVVPVTLPYGDMPDWLEKRMDLIKKQPGFWRDLPRIEIGIEICEFLQNKMDFRLMVLSKGPRSTTAAWSEKAEWALKNLPEAGVTVTRDKYPLSGKGLVYGKVLFDDYPTYVRQWLDHRPRGKVLMLETSYNQDFNHPNVLKIKRWPFLTSIQAKMISGFILRSDG